MMLQRLLRVAVRRAIAFIQARPRLNLFVRDQVARHPVLAGRLRTVMARSRQQAIAPLRTYASDSDLPDSALEVLDALQRAIAARRP